MTTVMARKTSLENEQLRNCDYLRLSHLVRILSVMFAKYGRTELVRAPFNYITVLQRTKRTCS